MTQERYIKVSEWFMSHRTAYVALKVVYRYMAYVVAVAYIVLIILSISEKLNITENTPLVLAGSNVLFETSSVLVSTKLILTPLTSFILVSVVRKCIDAKRPYEKYDIKPLFIKETKGNSMPSRHVFSITVIAMCWLYVSMPVGIILMCLVALMAASRVLAGVHFIRDVVCGFVVGILSGFLGLWVL